MTISVKIPVEWMDKYLGTTIYGNKRVQGPVVTIF